jgi:hypothetical protein
MEEYVSKAQCYQTREKDIVQLNANTQAVEDLRRRMEVTEKTHEVIQEMGKNIATMVVHLENFQTELKNQGKRLNALEDIPKLRWNATIQAVITLLVGSIGTIVIQHLLN